MNEAKMVLVLYESLFYSENMQHIPRTKHQTKRRHRYKL